MAQGRDRDFLRVAVLSLVQAVRRGDGRGVDGLAVGLAGRVGGLAGHGRVHALGVGLVVLALVVGHRGKAIRGLCPGEVHKRPLVAQGDSGHGLAVRVLFAVQRLLSVHGCRVHDFARLGAGRIGRIHAQFGFDGPGMGLVVLADVIGNGGGVTVLVVTRPGEARELPIVVQSFRLIDDLGLGLEGRVLEGRGVSCLARFFAGRGLGDLARRVHGLGLDVRLIVLAHAGRRHRAVVLRPHVGDFAPIVADRVGVHGLALRVLFLVQTVFQRNCRSIDDFAAFGAGSLGLIDRQACLNARGVVLVSQAEILCRNGGVAVGVVARPFEAVELPLVAEGRDRDFLRVGMFFAVRAVRVHCRGIDGLAGFLTGRLDRFRADARISGHRVRGIVLADIVCDSGGVAVGVVAGPGEVHKLPFMILRFEGRRVGHVLRNGSRFRIPAGEGVGTGRIIAAGRLRAVVAGRRAAGHILVDFQLGAVVVDPGDGVFALFHVGRGNGLLIAEQIDKAIIVGFVKVHGEGIGGVVLEALFEGQGQRGDHFAGAELDLIAGVKGRLFGNGVIHHAKALVGREGTVPKGGVVIVVGNPHAAEVEVRQGLELDQQIVALAAGGQLHLEFLRGRFLLEDRRDRLAGESVVVGLEVIQLVKGHREAVFFALHIGLADRELHRADDRAVRDGQIGAGIQKKDPVSVSNIQNIAGHVVISTAEDIRIPAALDVHTAEIEIADRHELQKDVIAVTLG